MTEFERRKIQLIRTAMDEIPIEQRLAICTSVVSGAAPIYHNEIEAAAQNMQLSADQKRAEHFGSHELGRG